MSKTEQNTQELIDNFRNLTQMAYGLYDITSIIPPTTPHFSGLVKIEQQTEKNIGRFIKKYINNSDKALQIVILQFLTDTGGDYNGDDTVGRRRLNFCSNPTKHIEEFDCCYSLYKERLESLIKNDSI